MSGGLGEEDSLVIKLTIPAHAQLYQALASLPTGKGKTARADAILLFATIGERVYAGLGNLAMLGGGALQSSAIANAVPAGSYGNKEKVRDKGAVTLPPARPGDADLEF